MRVASVWYCGEEFFVTDELLNEVFKVLVVAIIVESAVMDEVVAFQLFDVGHGRVLAVVPCRWLIGNCAAIIAPLRHLFRFDSEGRLKIDPALSS